MYRRVRMIMRELRTWKMISVTGGGTQERVISGSMSYTKWSMLLGHIKQPRRLYRVDQVTKEPKQRDIEI